MPYRKYPRRRRRRRRLRRYRRRRTRRSRKSASMRVSMKRMPSLFPDNALVAFKYKDIFEISIQSGAEYQEHQTFSLNNPGQPSVSVSSTLKPMGWNQWASFYNDFICYSSKITVTIMSNNSTSYEFYLGPDGNQAPPTFTQAGSLPYYRNRSMPGLFQGIGSLSNKASVKALEGRRIGSELDYGGEMAAPSVPKEYYWQCIQTNNFDMDMLLSMKVTIIYYCRLYGRKLGMAASLS